MSIFPTPAHLKVTQNGRVREEMAYAASSRRDCMKEGQVTSTNGRPMLHYDTRELTKHVNFHPHSLPPPFPNRGTMTSHMCGVCRGDFEVSI